jgi:hypothetical protein
MNIEELKKGFFVEEDALKVRLEPVVMKVRDHCRIDKQGQVMVISSKLSTRDQLMLVLAARAIASQLDSTIAAEVSVPEIAKYTGLPTNQIRARGKDAIKMKFAESTKPGVYRAFPHKVEAFLDSISVAPKEKNVSR